MNCRHHDRTYTLNFIDRRHADKIVKKTSEGCRIRVVEVDPVLPNSSVSMHVAKQININKLSCIVQKMELADALAYPFIHNVGVAVVYDILEEDVDGFMLEGQLIDVDLKPDFMRHNLDDLFKSS